jgi:transcription initiation factor TFIIIB Brf1 subunit/transcription initiation factor TFIIB
MKNILICPTCPKCGGKWVYYDGAMGYESMVCNKCGVDIADFRLSPERPDPKYWSVKDRGKITMEYCEIIR